MRTNTTAAAPAIPGRATVEGTARFAGRFRDRYAEDFYRELPGALVGSSIGFGTYLGQPDDADDARYTSTAIAAIASGINVLDTAINYRCQRSERAIGRALRDVLDDERIARDALIVCTKGGYIPLDGAPPQTREGYQAYLRQEFLDRGLMSLEDIVVGGHCLAPAFLDHQIDRSRENLGVETIDLYYLHNPEQQLDVVPREQFRERLRRAFAALESRVERGDLGAYGCATWNGLRAEPGARNHLALAELVGIAREVGGDGHHFRAVQLPINLAMPEAVRAANQAVPGPKGRTRMVPLLEAASIFGVAVIASASLLQAKLAHGLPAQMREAFPSLRTDAQRALTFARTLPGVAVALVGMRRREHLEENLESATRRE